jgi:hypothetical protein
VRVPLADQRLTGRMAASGVFGLCFLALLTGGWLHWGALAGGTFVVASALAAARTRREDLLTVAVCPPALFFGAVIWVKVLTSGGLLAAVEGILITLSATAPWLLAGTALTLVIAFCRGLTGCLRALSNELHARPDPLTRPLPGGPARDPSPTALR